MLQLKKILRNFNELIVDNGTIYPLLFFLVIITLAKIRYNCTIQVAKYVYNYIVEISFVLITLHYLYNFVFTCYKLLHF